MNYWLVKSEPDDYSWNDFMADGKTAWDGVRNYQARNNLRKMQLDDTVLFYHSVSTREIVGVAKVTKEHFPDPTTDDDRWVAVEITPMRALPRPVSLSTVKATSSLQNMQLVTNPRLSVQEVNAEEFAKLIALSEDEGAS